MKLVVSTRNEDKLKEIRLILAGIDVELVPVAEIAGAPEVEETGTTLEENATLKALGVARAVGCAALADDTGLEVAALGGEPGVYSSRYAGPNATYDDNVEKLLSALGDVPTDQRGACFRTVVALATPEGDVRLVDGECRGIITTRRRGESGFGYDPVFVPDGGDQSFAEMGLDEKNRISHRGRAFRAAREMIDAWVKERACRDLNAGPSA